MTAQIRSAEVLAKDGRVAATVDLVDVGGGEQVVNVDGQPETRTHAASKTFHVRLISPDRMIPDTLLDVADYDDAIKRGESYARKLDARAKDLAGLTDDEG
jgi:hypothetical protein